MSELSGLHPLSPASVRVEELRWMFIALWPNVPPAGLVGWANLIVNQGAWATIKPHAVEALRVWRRLRAKLGDSREIPQEDR